MNWWQCCVRIFPFTILWMCAACSNSPKPEGLLSATPEEAYRRFMVANLTGDESAIRPLIIDNEDADVLWQGPYPPAVAAALSKQYQSMEISRVWTEKSGRVVLQSSAAPMPLTVVDVNGEWKVDAGPIIEFRQAAEKPKHE
jgi:hypothetical protein